MNALMFACLMFFSPAPSPAPAPGMRVIVVRHAEKASATERDPSLSAAGVARAAALDSLLANEHVVAIYVTPYKRTNETAALVAKRHNVKAIALDPADIPKYAKAVADSAMKKDGVILVVSHSNTIPAILEALGGKKIPDLCDPAYSHVFTVIPLRPVTVTDAHYGAKDPVDADKCAASGMKN